MDQFSGCFLFLIFFSYSYYFFVYLIVCMQENSGEKKWQYFIGYMHHWQFSNLNFNTVGGVLSSGFRSKL